MRRLEGLRVFWLVVLIWASGLGAPAGAAEDYAVCEEKVQAWHGREMAEMQVQPEQHQPGAVPKLQELLFFLHIPRTGGRTYHQCFLKVLYSPSERCPRSYDTLRLDPKKPECRLLSTHDDYSLITRLPKEATSVVTNVRDPAERLLSAYEFMVEIAARSLRSNPNEEPNAGARATLLAARKRSSERRRTETRNVWPWNYLVPLLEDDLWARRNQSASSFGPDNGSYDTPRLIMPLREFAAHPYVKDLIQNGGTMQVAGLTNNSCLPEAHLLRSCARDYEDLGELVLEVAKARLERMLYVGLTERHQDSARLFAHVIGRPLSSPAQVMNIPERLDPITPRRREHPAVRRRRGFDRMNPRMRDGLERMQSRRRLQGGTSLLQHYERCVTQQRGKYSARREHALKALDPIRFSKEERGMIPQEWIDEFRAMSKLDMGLLEHARRIFQSEQERYGKHMDAEEAAELALTNSSSLLQRPVEDDLEAIRRAKLPPIPLPSEFSIAQPSEMDRNMPQEEQVPPQKEETALEDKEAEGGRQKEAALAEGARGQDLEPRPRETAELLEAPKEIGPLLRPEVSRGEGVRQEVSVGQRELRTTTGTPHLIGLPIARPGRRERQATIETVEPLARSEHGEQLGGGLLLPQRQRETVWEWVLGKRGAGMLGASLVTVIAAASLWRSRQRIPRASKPKVRWAKNARQVSL